MVEIKNLVFGYSDEKIINDISITLKKGKITTLIGANGSGKSTLLGLITKNLSPNKGQILLDGKSIKDFSLKQFAKEVATVHQKNMAPDDLTVEKLVSYGRIPHTNILKSGECDEKVQWAIKATGLEEFAKRPIGTLSGGQKQRAFIALALAQGTKTLFLDEPTTFLDVKYQIEILKLVKSLNEEFGITIVMVLHDINQALAYSDEIIGLKGGKIVTSGEPNDAINADIIEQIYGIRLEVFKRNDSIFVSMV